MNLHHLNRIFEKTIIIAMTCSIVVAQFAKEEPSPTNSIHDSMSSFVYGDVSRKLERLRIDSKAGTIANRLKTISDEVGPDDAAFKKSIAQLINAIRDVSHHYQKVFLNGDTLNTLPDLIREDIAQVMLDHETGIQSHLKLLTESVTSQSGTLLRGLARYMQEREDECEMQDSAQQYLYELLRFLVHVELKGYSAIEWALRLLPDSSEDGSPHNGAVFKEKSAHRLSVTFDAFVNITKDMSRLKWRCDPSKHEIDISFTELELVFKKIIYLEKDFSTDQCRLQCPRKEFEKDSISCAYEEDICSLQRSCNKVTNCEEIEGLNLFIPENKPDKRYVAWQGSTIERGFFGTAQLVHRKKIHSDQPQGKIRYTGHRKSYTMNQNRDEIVEECTYCSCVCSESTYGSDRIFSLDAVESSVTAGYVVTGLRLKKILHTVYIEIQEGQLKQSGLVERTTVRWRETFENQSSIDRSDPRVTNRKYYRLDWVDRRTVYLDDINLFKNQVVTGVMFEEQKVGASIYALKLMVRSTSFNFTSGKLNEKSEWLGNENQSERTKLELKDREAPNFITNASKPDSQDNQYLEFDTTGYDTKDIGQSTVPFLDIQEVVTNPPMALSGVGLYHKGVPESGGYLGFRISTYDITPHLEDLRESIPLS